ncbi:MAG: MBL fold metallo-hydrolase, partial [Planctomycetes bacterium]|nr:MBL fold metallo-hydrolase [Planctomycetota bacterium]
ELLIDEKQRFLEDVLARGVKLFFTHDTEVAMSDLAKDERGKFTTSNDLGEFQALELEAA